MVIRMLTDLRLTRLSSSSTVTTGFKQTICFEVEPA